MRLLLIEDDEKIADFITKGLKQAGFAVDHADNGIDGLHLALTEPYDVAVFSDMTREHDITAERLLQIMSNGVSVGRQKN